MQQPDTHTGPDSDSGRPLVEIENVDVAFGAAPPVFSGLRLTINAGERLALLGPNGAGKSTLLRLLQGELRPAQYPGAPERQGRVLWYFDGRPDASALSARERVRMVSPAQQGNYARRGWKLSGEEILLSGLENAVMVQGEASAREYARAASLAEAAGASALLSLTAPAMSQGQLRLMLILRALMSRPALLLLDEPFDGLDASARRGVDRAVSLAAEKGCTLLASAHRPGDIPEAVSGALLLDKGVVRRAGPGEAPKTGPQAVPALSQWPGLPRPLPETDFVRDIQARKAPLLQLSGVDVFIERELVLRDIAWTVRPGEQWVVSGPNGAGKSTLLRLLYGEEFSAYGGTLLWRGKPRPDLEELRSGVGYVSDRLQDLYAYDLSAGEVVVSGLRGSVGLYHEPEEEERALARLWLERFGVAALEETPLRALSSGLARRVLLARALAAAPPVLLLDEPCTSLDAEGRALFLNALPALAAGGVQMIYVSHRAEDIGPLFTHELRLEAGRVRYAGARNLLRTDRIEFGAPPQTPQGA